MSYLGQTFGVQIPLQVNVGGGGHREALIMVVEDGIVLSDAFRQVCECLDVAIERLPTTGDLGGALRRRRPMAVVATMDGAGQDGCNVLMTVAAHCNDLPVALVTGDDPVMLGAVDAVEELWQLTAVETWQGLPGIGAILDFVFRAGRRGGCMRLMSV